MSTVRRLTNRRAQLCLFTVLVLIAVVSFSVASSKQFGALARNSLIWAPSIAADFDWAPGHAPSTYLRELSEAPPVIVQATASALTSTSATDLQKATDVGRFVGDNPRHGKPIQSDTLTTYKQVKQNGRGYCADYSQLFLAFANSAGLPAREWGFGLHGFDAGHAFNEFYARDLEKWVFIDIFHSFYVVDGKSRLPLSALEFQQRLLANSADQSIEIVAIAASQFDLHTPERAIAYYARGARYFYLLWGDNVFSYDNHPVVKWASRLSRSLEVLVAVMWGVQPQIRISPYSDQGEAVTGLKTIRALLLGAAAALFLGSLALLAQLIAHRSHDRPGTGRPSR